MAANFAWYSGQCVKRHDAYMTVKVIASRSEIGWSLVESPQKLFPKTGEIEIRLPPTPKLHPNDWVSFQLNPMKTKGKWKASIYHSLYPFLDMREIETLDALRDRLTNEGVGGINQSGVWVIRYNETNVIKLQLIRSSDNRYRITATENFHVYVYNPELHYQMPSTHGDVFLYEVASGGESVQDVDWSPDDRYVSRIARAMSAANDVTIDTVIGWLKRHADENTGQIGSRAEDRLAVQQAARSGALANQLIADKILLKEITDILISDSRFVVRLDNQIKLIAEQERDAIKVKLQTELDLEFNKLKRQRLFLLEDEVNSKRDSHARTLDEQFKQDLKSRTAELEKSLSEREIALEAEFEARRQKLQLSTDQITGELKLLERDLSAVGNKIDTANKTLSVLKNSESLLLEHISQLKQDAESIQVPRSLKIESVLRFEPQRNVKTLEVSEIQEIIESCILLTPLGKEQMALFVATILAGEVPLLHGPQTQDFLLAAETLLSSGRSFRIQADPTVITFEDLWLRAGTQLPTALTYALELADGYEPVSVLSIIENVERSGARFWYPALAERSRRGDLPRRFFVCATAEDIESEEYIAASKHALCIEISGAIAPAAPVVGHLALAKANLWQLDPGNREDDISSSIAVVAPLVGQITLTTALRLARIMLEWGRINPEVNSTGNSKSLIELLMNRHGK